LQKKNLIKYWVNFTFIKRVLWTVVNTVTDIRSLEEWYLLGCYGRVALVRTDVSEETSAFFIRVTRIGELGTTQAATSNRRTLRRFLSP
jgi:hypothetical protein